jgi:hypothetical protein
VCLAYVAVCRATDTLTLVKDPKRVKGYKATYRLLGVLMLALPSIDAILVSFFKYDGLKNGHVRIRAFNGLRPLLLLSR